MQISGNSISHNIYLKHNVIPFKKKNDLSDKCKYSTHNQNADASRFSKYYPNYIINFTGTSRNIPSTCSLAMQNIPNFRFINGNSARGESLSSKKNRKYLKELHKNGIDTVIDLRDKYTSKFFPELCCKNDLKYYHIPIDSSCISDDKIIESLPLFFELMNRGHFYIACAQGLHRTDIALSINYVFNPKSAEPPVLIGHFREGDFKFDDVARRLNSLKKTITPENQQNLGWGDSFEEEFFNRKKNLAEYNRSLISLTKDL